LIGVVVGQLQLQIRAGKAVTAPLILFLFFPLLWMEYEFLLRLSCEQMPLINLFSIVYARLESTFSNWLATQWQWQW
jgi:hypothetical protein